MKPFNLTQALAGQPVVTRDGRKVMWIAHDPGAHAAERIVARIASNPYHSVWHETGRHACDDSLDLFMGPQKKEGWVNVYPNMDTSVVHPTKEDANNAALASRLACCKIEWEE